MTAIIGKTMCALSAMSINDRGALLDELHAIRDDQRAIRDDDMVRLIGQMNRIIKNL